MTTAKLFWNDYKYFPYERELARKEVKRVFGVSPKDFGAGLCITGQRFALNDFKRLTYFKCIEVGPRVVVPDQVWLESSANGKDHARSLDPKSLPVLKRQSTRYSAHGLHDYKGKFNPQMVRAIGNIVGLRKNAWVLDPFCGSGTTLLEAAHIGWNCIGTDLNPLGVLISNAKIKALTVDVAILNKEAARISDHLDKLDQKDSVPDRKIQELPNNSYLVKWFTKPVLNKLAIILRAISTMIPRDSQDIFRVILSDLIRKVSLQDPCDLRIRRRKNPPEDFPVIRMFVDSLQRKVRTLACARKHATASHSRQIALVADSQNYGQAIKGILSQGKRKSVDAAITSPPYATALPYIDTQRLSLCVLGLIDSDIIRSTEKSLIGNREITDSERRQLEDTLVANTAKLPGGVIKFCRRLLRMSQGPGHGFRRRNVPALVYKYLAGMKETFREVFTTMKVGGKYALVVGSNKTELQGESIKIETPRLLADIAETQGWQVEETITLNTYSRFDLHQKNSIKDEVLLILRSPERSRSRLH